MDATSFVLFVHYKIKSKIISCSSFYRIPILIVKCRSSLWAAITKQIRFEFINRTVPNSVVNIIGNSTVVDNNIHITTHNRSPAVRKRFVSIFLFWRRPFSNRIQRSANCLYWKSQLYCKIHPVRKNWVLLAQNFEFTVCFKIDMKHAPLINSEWVNSTWHILFNTVLLSIPLIHCVSSFYEPWGLP